MIWGRRPGAWKPFLLALLGGIFLLAAPMEAKNMYEPPFCMDHALLVLGKGDFRPSSTADPEMIGRLLLSSFARSLRVISLDAYSPEASAGMDLTLFLAPERRKYTVEFPREGVPVLWIGPGLPWPNPCEEYFTYDPKVQQPFDHIVYRSMGTYVGGQETLPPVTLLGSSDVEIYAYATDLQKRYPYVFGVPREERWFVATTPYWGRYLLPLGELLSGFCTAPEKKRRLFVRLEGITPFTSPEKLRRVGEWLDQRKVSFGMAYRPQVRELLGGDQVLINHEPELVRVMRSFAARGALLILDHQFGTCFTKLEGAEAFFSESLENSLALSQKAGLYPSAIQASNYVLSPEYLQSVSRFFPLLFGRIQVSCGDSGATFMTLFPGKIGSMDYLPETLGYVRKEDPQGSVIDILARARDLALVEGALGSFGYAPEFGVELLASLVESLGGIGYVAAENKELYPRQAAFGGEPLLQKESFFQRWSGILGSIFLGAGAFFVLFILLAYLRASRKRKKDLFK